MPKQNTKKKSDPTIYDLEHHLVPIKYRIPFYMGLFMGAIVAQVLMISFLSVISV